MSVKNVKEFLNKAESNKILGQKLERVKDELQSTDTNHKNYNNIINTKIIPLAKDFGFDFTVKDFLDYVDEIFSELDEKDLLNVSGGFSTNKSIAALSLILAFAPFAPSFIAGAEGKPPQSNQSSHNNQSTPQKFTPSKPSKLINFAPTILGGKSITEQIKNNLVDFLKKNNISTPAQIDELLNRLDENSRENLLSDLMRVGSLLVENTINGTYYLRGTIPDENQTNELNLIYKWYNAQRSEPQEQVNIDFTGLDLSSDDTPENPSTNQNTTNELSIKKLVKEPVIKIVNKIYTTGRSFWQKTSALFSKTNNVASEPSEEPLMDADSYMSTFANSNGSLEEDYRSIKDQMEDILHRDLSSPTVDKTKKELSNRRAHFAHSTLATDNTNSVEKLTNETETNQEPLNLSRIGSDLRTAANRSSGSSSSDYKRTENQTQDILHQDLASPSIPEAVKERLAKKQAKFAQNKATATLASSSETPSENKSTANAPVGNPEATSANKNAAEPMTPATNLGTPSEHEVAVAPMPSQEAPSTNENVAKPVVPITGSEAPSANENVATPAVADSGGSSANKVDAAPVATSPVHYVAVNRSLSIQEQLRHVYNTLRNIRSYDDLDSNDGSQRFFVVDFNNIIGATYNAATDTFDGADDTMNANLQEFCFRNGIHPHVRYIEISDENASGLQITANLAETIRRVNYDLNNISNRSNFIRDLKKIVCWKNYDSKQYGYNWETLRNFYQDNVNNDDMEIYYDERSSKLSVEENIDNLIKTGNEVNYLREFNDHEGTQSSFNFLTDLDYYASFIRYDTYLETFVFGNLPVTQENLERAKNFVNIYYHFLSQKINYNDEKPSNYEELSLEEKIKFLSETHDKMMGMLLELDKKSIPYFINDLKNLKDEYNVEFPSQLENTIVNTSEQNTNNGNQPPKNKKV